MKQRIKNFVSAFGPERPFSAACVAHFLKCDISKTIDLLNGMAEDGYLTKTFADVMNPFFQVNAMEAGQANRAAWRMEKY